MNEFTFLYFEISFLSGAGISCKTYGFECQELSQANFTIAFANFSTLSPQLEMKLSHPAHHLVLLPDR